MLLKNFHNYCIITNDEKRKDTELMLKQQIEKISILLCTFLKTICPSTRPTGLANGQERRFDMNEKHYIKKKRGIELLVLELI